MSTHPEPIESAQVHQAENERKTVNHHHAFRESLAAPAREYDELDLLVEELRAGEFEERASQP